MGRTPVATAVIYTEIVFYRSQCLDKMSCTCRQTGPAGRDAVLLVVRCGGVRGLCELDGCVNGNSAAAKSNTIHYGIRLSVL